jgi:hypothetical protein
MSMLLPGPMGITIRTGFTGNDCAQAMVIPRQKAKGKREKVSFRSTLAGRLISFTGFPSESI